MKTSTTSTSSGESWRPDRPWKWGALACGAIALCLEAVSLAGLNPAIAGRASSAGMALGAHAAALVFFYPCFLALMPASYLRHKSVSALLVFGLGSPLPLSGLLFLAGLAVIVRFLRRTAHPEKEFHFGDRQYMTVSDYAAGGGTEARSILEILNQPNEEARRKAILAMRHLEPKLALPLLRKGLLDSDDRVRLFSQGLFLKVVRDLDESVRELEERLAGAPKDLDLKLRMAEFLHESVYLGVAQEESHKSTLDRAIALVDEAIAADPGHRRARWLKLKYAIKNKNLEQARESIRVLREMGANPVALLPWEIEMAFLERNWERLRRLVDAIPPSHAGDPVFREIRAGWPGAAVVKP